MAHENAAENPTENSTDNREKKDGYLVAQFGGNQHRMPLNFTAERRVLPEICAFHPGEENLPRPK